MSLTVNVVLCTLCTTDRKNIIPTRSIYFHDHYLNYNRNKTPAPLLMSVITADSQNVGPRPPHAGVSALSRPTPPLRPTPAALRLREQVESNWFRLLHSHWCSDASRMSSWRPPWRGGRRAACAAGCRFGSSLGTNVYTICWYLFRDFWMFSQFNK